MSLPFAPRGGKVELPPTLYLKQFKLIFASSLFGLLVLHILSYHLGVQAHCVDAVAFSPEMITPIGFVLKLSELIEDAYRRSALYHATEIGQRDLRRYHRQQMHMIGLNIHFDDLNLLLFREGSYAVTHFIANRSAQDSMTVFWDPNNMVLAVPNGM